MLLIEQKCANKTLSATRKKKHEKLLTKPLNVFIQSNIHQFASCCSKELAWLFKYSGAWLITGTVWQTHLIV
jgi:hypothetical protein